MISISTERKNGGYVLAACGHAGTAPHGEDLVCAAVSMLVQTAAAIIRKAKEEGRASGGCIYLEEGDSVLQCYTMDPATDLMLRGVETGFILLAKDFPAAVKYEKKM